MTSPTFVTSWRRQRSLHRDIAYVRYIVTWRRSMPSNLMWSCDVKLSAKRDDVENVLSQSTIRRKRRHKADVRTSLSNRLSMRRKHHFDCQYFINLHSLSTINYFDWYKFMIPINFLFSMQINILFTNFLNLFLLRIHLILLIY